MRKYITGVMQSRFVFSFSRIDKKEERLFYIKKRRGCALVLTQPLVIKMVSVY